MNSDKHIYCEPLESLLTLYQNTEEVLFQFLPDETVEQLTKHAYLNAGDEIFVNEYLWCVDKQTGILGSKGKIVDITDSSDNKKLFTIRTQGRNLRISPENYYLFKKQRTHKQGKEQADFLKNLLENL